MPTKTTNDKSRIKVHDMPDVSPRSGGEARPFDFPHLYRIRAGDWRISYAVEHDRLAVLVLEVLHPDKSAEEDPEREVVARKMKIRLLDLPEGKKQSSPVREPVRKSMVKLLNPDHAESTSDRAGQRVRLSAQVGSTGEYAFEENEIRSRVTLLEVTPMDAETAFEEEISESEEGIIEGKVTPLDSPSE